MSHGVVVLCATAWLLFAAAREPAPPPEQPEAHWHVALELDPFPFVGRRVCFLSTVGLHAQDTPGRALGYWVTPAPALGFQLLLWRSGPYVTLWGGLGIPLFTRDRHLDGHTYDEPRLFPVLGVHIGYEQEL